MIETCHPISLPDPSAAQPNTYQPPPASWFPPQEVKRQLPCNERWGVPLPLVTRGRCSLNTIYRAFGSPSPYHCGGVIVIEVIILGVVSLYSACSLHGGPLQAKKRQGEKNSP